MTVQQLRITNITGKQNGGVGRMLDTGEEHKNKIIGNGKSIFINADPQVLPEPFAGWVGKGWVTVHGASDGELHHGPIGGEITAAGFTPEPVAVSRNPSEMDDEDFFGEPDITNAREANLEMGQFRPGQTVGAHSPDLRQQSNARVTLGMETEKHSNDISPIPGDRPRSVDNSQDFTVKAPSRNY